MATRNEPPPALTPPPRLSGWGDVAAPRPMNIAPRRQAPWWLFRVILDSGYRMRLHWDKPEWKLGKMWVMTRALAAG